MNSAQKRQGLRPWLFGFVGVSILLVVTECTAGVTGLRQVPFKDTGKVFQVVQVLPNYSYTPDCNVDYCGVLFTDGNADLYVPRTYTLGPGRPAYYDLHLLEPYQLSDGSILYAPRGSGPTEYTTASGQIRVQFAFVPGVQYGGGLHSRRGGSW